MKEYNIDDEDKLLEAIMLEPETDEDWDKGWTRIVPKKRYNIKEIFKYDIILPIRMSIFRFWRRVFNNRRHAKIVHK